MFSVKTEVKIVEDLRKLVKAVDDANKKAVKRAGPLLAGFIKRTIRSGRGKKRNPSKPGNPPKSHVGKAFGLKWIRWKYNEQARTNIVYPIKGRGEDVPATLEFGGRAAVKLKNGKVVYASIARRPYINKSIDQFKRKYPDLWRSALS